GKKRKQSRKSILNIVVPLLSSLQTMKKILLLPLCFVLCLATGVVPLPVLQARDTVHSYTAYAPGDTVIPYGDNNRYTVRLYAFIDDTFCDTCMQALAAVANAVSEQAEVQVVLFVRTQSKVLAERVR